jgi:hypothetical protein
VNVLTVAEAAAAAGASGGAGGAGSGSTAAGGGAAGSGGGLSATTIGIVGGVAAAGAVAGTQVLGGGDASIFRGSFSMNTTLTFGGCARQENHSGVLEFRLESTSGTITGNGEIRDAGGVVTATTCQGPLQAGSRAPWGMRDGPVTGTESAISFQLIDVVTNADGITFNRSFTFQGALSGDTITGRLEMVWFSSQPNAPGMSLNGTITLQKQ